jgi:hypothetical protein
MSPREKVRIWFWVINCEVIEKCGSRVCRVILLCPEYTLSDIRSLGSRKKYLGDYEIVSVFDVHLSVGPFNVLVRFETFQRFDCEFS